MKKLVLTVVLGVAGLAAVAAVRAARLESRQVPPRVPAPVIIDAVAAAWRLAAAVRFPTISWEDAAARDAGAFLGLQQHLLDSFPNVARALTREVIATYSLLYTWRGTDDALPPVILIAHLDVVPADPAGWTHPPFGGAIADGRVWGRGTIDDKSGVLGLLEAVEGLVASGYKPTRTVYLGFSHNEEGGGDQSGARAAAAALEARGVRNAWLLDEGGLIYDRLRGVAHPVALVGVSEKTALTFELSVRSAGGHASMPPRETAIGILARAIDRLERRPPTARLDGAALGLFQTLAAEMTLPMRLVFANLWLTRPLVLRLLADRPETNATIRTTIAPTMIEGSPKANVLAGTARAILNVRLLPGDSPEAIHAYIRGVVGDDRVEIARTGPDSVPAAGVSPIDTPEFGALAGAIRAIYSDVLVAPYLTMAATDAREYAAVAPHAYRFLPVYQDGALDAIHGVNESLRLDAYERAIRIYATIIREVAR